MSSEFTIEIAVAGKWEDGSLASIKRMLGALSGDMALTSRVCEAIKSKTNDEVLITFPSGDINNSDGSPPALVLAILLTDNVDTRKVVDSFSERLKSVIKVSPIVLLAHQRPAIETAKTILEIKRQIEFSHWQVVSEIDVSGPASGTVHSTWPAETVAPEKTFKASDLSDDDTGTLIVLDAKSAFADLKAGTMHLLLDEAWCFEERPRRSARPRTVTRADPNDGPRKRLNSLSQQWLQRSERDIVWESEQESQPKLHESLKALREYSGQVSFRPNHPSRWSDRISALSAHDIAGLDAAIKDIWDDANPEVANTDQRSEGLEAYLALINGQCSALEINPPADPEKLAADLASDADRALSEAIEALSSYLTTRIKHGDAARNVINRLGWSEVLKEDKFRFVMPGPKPFDHRAKLRISEKGQQVVSSRISMVMTGVCQAQSEILRMYWLRVIRPAVFVELNRQMQNGERVTPRLTDFDINQTGFEGLDPNDIREEMKWPKEQSITKLFNLSFYLKEVMKMVRLFGRLAGLAVVVGVGVNFTELGSIFERISASLTKGFDGCDSFFLPFVCKPLLLIKNIWSEVSPFLAPLLVILLLTVAPSLFKLFGMRAEVQDKIGDALEPCVEAKLSELAGSWKKHLDVMKSQFICKLRHQIEEQLAAPISQHVSRQQGALAHVLADKESAVEALKGVTSELKKNKSDIKSQEDSLKKISRELAKL